MAKRQRFPAVTEPSTPVSFDYLRDLFPSAEQKLQRELLALQIEEAKAKEAARSANPKSEGSAQRARKLDGVVIALLASDGGWLAADLSDAAKELLRNAELKGYFPDIEPRQVKARLEAALKEIAKHK